MKNLFVKFLLALCLVVGTAHATVVSGIVTNNNVALANGSITLQLYGCINPLINSANGAAATTSYSFSLSSSGALPTGSVMGNDVIYCSGSLNTTYYEIKAFNAANGLVWDRYYRITGAYWNIGTATVLTNFATSNYIESNPSGDQVISTPVNNKFSIVGGSTLIQKLSLGQDPINSNDAATKSYVDAASGKFVFPSAGIVLSTGLAWQTSVAAPIGVIVGTTDTQILINKTLDGVTPTTFSYLNPTSSVQGQFNSLTNGVAASEKTANKGVTNGYASLDSTGRVPFGQLPNTIITQVNGTNTSNQNLLNLVAGSGITITTSSNGTIIISVTGGGSTSSTSSLPTPPNTAYIYSNLQQEATNCPSYTSPSSQASLDNCWTADSIDATGAAGAGITTPTNLQFGINSPALSNGGSMLAAVSNAPAQVTSATGTSGASSIVVSSVANITNKGTTAVTGTGIGSGAQIALSWNGTSTTIPLTVANTGTVSGNLTFTTNFVSNSLFYRKLPVTAAPIIGTTTPTPSNATIVVSAGAVTTTSNTVTFSNMTASDSNNAYTITAIQVYIDNAAQPTYTNGTGSGPYSPASFTTGALNSGNHTFAVKAFNSHGDSAIVNVSVSLGGGPATTLANMLEDVYYWPDSANQAQAYEWDPDLFLNGYHYVASMQCDVASGSAAPGQWRFWNATTQQWVTTSTAYSCTAAYTPGQWHEYQLYVTYDNVGHTYTYQTFVVDGVTIYKNLGLNYPALSGQDTTPYIVIQHQIDNTSAVARSGLGNKMYYDNYTLTVW